MPFKNYFKLHWFIVCALFFGTVLLGIRFFIFTRSYAATLPYMDQLELYWPFIHNPSPFSLFIYQYGPHRQGLGYIITYLVSSISQWNILAEVTLNTLVQIFTCILLLALKRSVFRRWDLTDIYIPLVVFSYRYTESFTIVPNISLAVLPIFLSVLGLCTWYIPATPWKYALTATIAVLVLFSGFGMLIFPVFAFLICVPLFRFPDPDIQPVHIIAPLCILIAGTLLFFYDYQIDTAVSCRVNPVTDWSSYPVFVGTEVISYFMRPDSFLPVQSRYIGFAACILLGILLGVSVKNFWQNTHRSHHGIHIILLGIPVMFAATSAFARTCLGVDAARAGRYMLYFMPGLVSLYFLLIRPKTAWVRGVIVVCVILFMLNEALVFRGYADVAKNHYQFMERWYTCYVQYPSVTYCNSITQFLLVPPRLDAIAGDVLDHVVR